MAYILEPKEMTEFEGKKIALIWLTDDEDKKTLDLSVDTGSGDLVFNSTSVKVIDYQGDVDTLSTKLIQIYKTPTIIIED